MERPTIKIRGPTKLPARDQHQLLATQTRAFQLCQPSWHPRKPVWPTCNIMSKNKGLLLYAIAFQGHLTTVEKSSSQLGELPVHLKASGCLRVQKSGEMNPGRQEQLNSPGMLVQTVLGPQRVKFLEHSSTSKQKIGLSHKGEGC